MRLLRALQLVMCMCMGTTEACFGVSFFLIWDFYSWNVGNLATRWTELLRRGGCQLQSLVLQKGGYVSLCAFSGRCSLSCACARAPQRLVSVSAYFLNLGFLAEIWEI